MESEADFNFEALRPSEKQLQLLSSVMARNWQSSTHSCSLGQETAEKQAPSALDFVGHFGKALQSEIDSGKKLPMSQAIGQLVSAYNAKIKVKRWRVDSAKKRIVLNLLRCPLGSDRALGQALRSTSPCCPQAGPAFLIMLLVSPCFPWS